MKTQKVSLNIPADVLERVDKLADLAEIDRTRLMVNILDECSKTLMTTEKVGILQFSKLLRNFGERMEEWAKSVRAKKIEPL